MANNKKELLASVIRIANKRYGLINSSMLELPAPLFRAKNESTLAIQ